MADNPLEELGDSLDDKVKGVPVWVIGLGLGLVIGLIWYFYTRNSGEDPTSVRVFDPESAEAAETEDEEPQNSDYGLPNGPIGDWLSENPGSSAYPVNQNSLPITNAQWGRYVSDTFLSKGDDPTIVSGAISKYLSGKGLNAAEKAVINRALALMTPPEGVLQIVDYIADTTLVAPTGLKIVSINRNSVRLSWNKVTGATSYRMVVNENGRDSFRTEAILTAGTIAFLAANKSYRIGVRGVNALGKEGPVSYITVKTKK